VFDLCLSWRDMTAAELDQEGAGHMVQLVDNLSEAIGDLEHILTITLPKPEPVQQRRLQGEKIVSH
jgi:two-component system sensor histidine kinase RpfC